MVGIMFPSIGQPEIFKMTSKLAAANMFDSQAKSFLCVKALLTCVHRHYT